MSLIPKLAFEYDAALVRAPICLSDAYQSHAGVVHGGVVATVLDQIMAEAAGRALSQHVLTVGLRVRYIEPMRTNEPYRLEARILSLDDGHVTVQGEMIGHDLVAAATATFRGLRRPASDAQPSM